MLENIPAPMLQAALGGLMLSILNLWEDHNKPKARRFDKDIGYWFFFCVWPAVGAVLAYIYIASGYKIDGMLAFTLGLTAPATLQTISQKVRPEQSPQGAEE